MIRAILRNAGIQPKRWFPALLGWVWYVRDRKLFRTAPSLTDFDWGKELPILNERNEQSGSLGAYFLQDQLVARWVYHAAPARHVDIGSRLDGFIGSISVFREVEVIDIRPQDQRIRHVQFHQLDLMNELPIEWLESTDSLSCLHTIEHFGLGRYGDRVDPNGHLKGLEQLKKMVKPGGVLYLSTPIGPQRIEFNAHRIFAPETVLSWFDEDWEIVRCAVMDDEFRLNEDAGVEGLRGFRGDLGLGILCAKRVVR